MQGRPGDHTMKPFSMTCGISLLLGSGIFAAAGQAFGGEAASAPKAVFGVVTDIHYADKPDGGRGGVRTFRSSLQRLGACVEDLNRRRVAMVIQMGDIVDSDQAYPVPPRPNLEAAMRNDLRTILSVAHTLEMPLYHVLGNHDTDAGEESLRTELGMDSFHYDFILPDAPGWRFVVVNGMDSGRRIVGPAQLEWLSRTLRRAAGNGERVIGFCHYSLVQDAAPNHDILRNSQRVLDELDRAGNVVAWFSGHDHGGGYAVRRGVHFVTLPAMADAADRNAYATVEIHGDKLVVNGMGTVKSRELPFGSSPAPTAEGPPAGRPYVVVDTGQSVGYDAVREIPLPRQDERLYGQDAHYHGPPPAYRDNRDGTISDLNTGLMWTSAGAAKMTWACAMEGAAECRSGGHRDWRLPTIKELYSLILFSGTDPDPRGGEGGFTPFIDTRYFPFRYGRAEDGERIIDAQYATATRCVSPVMQGIQAMFGVNFADGRIKAYPIEARGPRTKTYLVLYVRGNPSYGRNDFVDHGDGTVTDRATGLMWMKEDCGRGMTWEDALAYCENLEFAGHSDWRLPNAKELQSIVDYTRSPDTTRSAALAPVFQATEIVNEGGAPDYASYWTGTTHASPRGGRFAVYVSFGRALGWMPDRLHGGPRRLLDVHGAGAQRSDPKAGDPGRYPEGRGPQGDVVRIQHHVRAVRAGPSQGE